MLNSNKIKHRGILERIAYKAMLERGLVPDFPAQVFTELEKINEPASSTDVSVRDMTNLLWCSIDNDSSLDLDQLTAAESYPDGLVKIFVAIADVDAIVKKRTEIDNYASQNTLSVYTPARIFSMLPEKLSTDLTSLSFNSERLAIIIEITINTDGSIKSSDIYRARVRNRAKLAYNSIAAWLDGIGSKPDELSRVKGLDENIRLQEIIARKMKFLRYENGALNLVTLETQSVFEGDKIKSLKVEGKNRATDIIEDFMIAANGVAARFLESRKFPSIRRIVHTPARWDRIVELAREKEFKLPDQPDSKALEQFLLFSKASDPLYFTDVSLSVIKLLGPGEYVLELPGNDTEGHFGLAVKDYTHSTAPNRRYPDLITQRLLKAAIAGQPVPYSEGELGNLASHCTEKEDAVKKVERHLNKSAAALLLGSMIGQEFDAIVTGASGKGTWVRIFQPPVEGRLSGGLIGLDVGHKLKVKLISTDVEMGYIDFKKAYS